VVVGLRAKVYVVLVETGRCPISHSMNLALTDQLNCSGGVESSKRICVKRSCMNRVFSMLRQKINLTSRFERQ
jgi:predicted transcriptional regulator